MRMYRVLLAGFVLMVIVSCDSRPEFNYDFETEADLDALWWKCGTFFTLMDEHVTSGRKCLKVEFFPDPGSGDHYPGLSLGGFARDWTGYQELRVDIFNPEQEPLKLAVRIDDSRNPPYKDRYNGTILLRVGANQASIKLEVLATPNNKKRLDLENIQRVIFFLVNPTKRHTLFFDNIRLK